MASPAKQTTKRKFDSFDANGKKPNSDLGEFRDSLDDDMADEAPAPSPLDFNRDESGSRLPPPSKREKKADGSSFVSALDQSAAADESDSSGDSFMDLISKFASLNIPANGNELEECPLAPLCSERLPLSQLPEHVHKCIKKLDDEDRQQLARASERLALKLTQREGTAGLEHQFSPPEVCKFGSGCKRKDLGHFVQVFHPPVLCPLCEDEFAVHEMDAHLTFCLDPSKPKDPFLLAKKRHDREQREAREKAMAAKGQTGHSQSAQWDGDEEMGDKSSAEAKKKVRFQLGNGEKPMSAGGSSNENSPNKDDGSGSADKDAMSDGDSKMATGGRRKLSRAQLSAMSSLILKQSKINSKKDSKQPSSSSSASSSAMSPIDEEDDDFIPGAPHSSPAGTSSSSSAASASTSDDVLELLDTFKLLGFTKEVLQAELSDMQNEASSIALKQAHDPFFSSSHSVSSLSAPAASAFAAATPPVSSFALSSSSANAFRTPAKQPHQPLQQHQHQSPFAQQHQQQQPLLTLSSLDSLPALTLPPAPATSSSASAFTADSAMSSS